MRVNVLAAMDADRVGEFAPMPTSHEKYHLSGWTSPNQSLSWTIKAPDTADYGVRALSHLEGKVAMQYDLSIDGVAIHAAYQPESAANEVQCITSFDSLLHITKGLHVITLRARVTPPDAPFEIQFLSLELTRPAVRRALEEKALAMRANTDWMRQASFGIGVHWTKRTMPIAGPQKNYEQAVDDFDTERFADQIASTGAQVLVFTTAHADQYLPFPNSALDSILPGRTTKRDMVADLIKSLKKRNIRLILYYNLGSSEDPSWNEATGQWETGSSRFFQNWQNIIAEAGRRYGTGLSGWWFDDGANDYYYRSPDWESLDRAAKAGNPQRAVCFNPWIEANPTQFQDFYCGEAEAPGEFHNKDGSLHGTVDKGGNGKIARGSFAGLQLSAYYTLENDWVHGKRDTPALQPRMTAEELANKLRIMKEYGGLSIVNVMVYQDGTIAPKSLETLREASKIAGLNRKN